ncbi:GNAT family N-acetyltransferase [Streptomyces sp. AC495_CC817]|uniref:GNAT family N-acetyltransferase n=1 Tax=Streptomyces sp. AC495_CC817 TaxID=2823900 RepID=UPI001C27ED43|nr:GNAT family N-acetyltransferase [Streptomyces sp. AC495_CC817]
MIRTDRLALRPWTVDDAGFHRDLWLERDPRVPPHRRIDADGRPTVDDLAGYIARASTEGPIRTLVVELRESGERLGYCGLVESGTGPADEPEIAFEFLRRHWGNGFATEAAHAIVDLARANGFSRLRASVWEWNTPSRRVLARLGFVESGPHRIDPERGLSLMTTLDL